MMNWLPYFFESSCLGGEKSCAMVLALLCSLAAPAWALGPDEIALVVNSQVPEGRNLAELYAAQRHIPGGRIIELRLDPGGVISPAEDVPFATYDSQIAPGVRQFLIANHLQDQVKCLVTFWGVPLRVGARTLSPAEKQELETVTRQLNDARVAVTQQVAALEQSAHQLSPAFSGGAGEQLPQLVARLDTAMTTIMRSLPQVKDPASRGARFLEAVSTGQRLLGSAQMRLAMAEPLLAPLVPQPPSSAALAQARAQLAMAQQEVAQAEGYSPADADWPKARELARQSLGLLGYASVLSAQKNSLEAQQTQSAVDSELALLWWHGYPRAGHVNNPLYWRAQQALRQPRSMAPPMLMVTRLDGPSPAIVRDIILSSIKIEQAGLQGIVALDARGKLPSDPYGQYDQTIRNLAELLREKTKLQVTLEDTEALIPAHSLKNIAVYCGWYSLRHYVPPGSFSPGAVGFHVASFEMSSLHNPGETGWVPGLLKDGVIGTLGPVAEPYLASFPPADEFFPLLMTGKLTLAEVYWRTTPWASWMQACIGDPLYVPYERTPPLKPQDLPQGMQVALEDPLMAHVVPTPAATHPARQ